MRLLHHLKLSCTCNHLYWQVFFLLWMGLLMPGEVRAALSQPPVEPIAHFTQTTYEQQYKAAKEHLQRLAQDATLGSDRSNWLNGARNFRRIHTSQKDTPLGPSSLYMVGKVYRQMYDRFQLALDLDNAIDSLLAVATLYPSNSLADDALLLAADSVRLDPDRGAEAELLYRRIIEDYAQGDQVDMARTRILSPKSVPLPVTAASVEPLAPAPVPVTVAAASAATSLASEVPPGDLSRIAPVKYWSSEDYTRIVIQATSPVQFKSTLLEKNGEQPRQLSIDFADSYIPPQSRNAFPIQDGLLKQARSDQIRSDTVRVILDIESLSDYKVFSLNDPFRVIIDVHGIRTATVAQDRKPVTEQKQPQVSTPAPRVAKTPDVKTEPTEDKKSESLITLEDQKKRKPSQTMVSGKYKIPGKEEISLAQQLGLGVRKIVIDPGHGGKDPGAMAFGLKEKDIVLKIARKVETILKNKHHFQVTLTRTKDIYLPLEERTAIANTQGGDLFISVHVNAHPDKTIGGIETYFLNLATNADAMRVAALENATSTHSISELQDILSDLMKNSKIAESSRLAQFIQTNLVGGIKKVYNTKDLGVKQAPFYVLIGAEMPAILAEISFITNPEEARLLKDEIYLQRIAEQIAAGIVAYVDHHHTAATRF